VIPATKLLRVLKAELETLELLDLPARLPAAWAQCR
jgi:hypothetical protein